MRDTLIITAEQVASLKALEQIQNLRLAEDAEQTVVANTDSKVTLDTLRNGNKHYILIGNIRKEIKMLRTSSVCVCVCMYVCMCVYVYVCVYVCRNVCVCM